LLPTFFSSTETENGLFSVVFTLPEEFAAQVADGSYIRIALPLRAEGDQGFLVPLDAIAQDQSHAWVLVEQDGKALRREVTLGEIHGNYAAVKEGVDPDTRILLNRTLLPGEAVEIR
jgi:multidrug efflux pump subunit AcrA (membrane-fusion protein)